MAIGKRGGAGVMVAVLALAPAQAQNSSPIAAELGSCLKIFGAVERLACYDRLARGVAPAGSGPAVAAPSYGPPSGGGTLAMRPPPPSAPLAAPSHPAQASASQFGSERLPQNAMGPATSVNRIIAGISQFDVNRLGKFTLTLSNGQVWQQVDGDEAIARPRKSARSVVIERAIFGSYNLAFNDSNQRYKVFRIK